MGFFLVHSSKKQLSQVIHVFFFLVSHISSLSQLIFSDDQSVTLPETNIAPEN